MAGGPYSLAVLTDVIALSSVTQALYSLCSRCGTLQRLFSFQMPCWKNEPRPLSHWIRVGLLEAHPSMHWVTGKYLVYSHLWEMYRLHFTWPVCVWIVTGNWRTLRRPRQTLGECTNSFTCTHAHTHAMSYILYPLKLTQYLFLQWIKFVHR